MAAAPKSRWKVEAAWGQSAGGLFTFGVSQFGGPDVLAASSWSASFDGPYNDLSALVLDANWDRGRDSDVGTMRASSLTAHLRDPTGLFNRKNVSSPLYAKLQDPAGVPIRVTGYDAAGGAHPRYYGFITDVEADPSGRGQVTIQAIDFLERLGREKPTIAPTAAGLTDGTIMGLLLDALQWTDPAMRSLDVGDTLPLSYDRAALGEKGALEMIEELLASERGIVFIGAAGAVTYLERRSRFVATPVAALDRLVKAFPIATSGGDIVNKWTVTRKDMAGNDIVGSVPGVALDQASADKHGTIPDTLDTPFLADDNAAQGLAEYLLMRTKAGLLPVYDTPLSIPDLATQQAVMARELGDLVTMTIHPLGQSAITDDFYIESISEGISSELGADRYTASWRVSETVATPFRFGISQMGGVDVLYY